MTETTETVPTIASKKDEQQEALWIDFCDKTFKLGQLAMWIVQTQGKLDDLEKQYEVAMKNARGAADKHDKYIASKKVGEKTPNVDATVQ